MTPVDEPERCLTCNGKGTVTRYRMDDRRYQSRCGRCRGSGIAIRALNQPLDGGA